MKTPSKKTTIKWMYSLQQIKMELNKNNYASIVRLTRKYNINQIWGTFLYKENIIYKDENKFWKWKENRQVNDYMIDKFREYQTMVNGDISKQIETQSKLQFDMNYIEIPAEIKAKARAESKTRTTKVKVQEPINIPTQQNEYGVIRKFLKWLW